MTTSAAGGAPDECDRLGASGEARLAGSDEDPPLRIAIVADNCSLRMGGEAALPYYYFQFLLARRVDVHLVCHGRNREELERAFPGHRDRLHLIADEPLHRGLHFLGRPLPRRVDRAGSSAGWSARGASRWSTSRPRSRRRSPR